jgi:LysM repeat protein
MENNDSNKLQQTGGLKLMTVFIAVLALHVIVIGGFTVYHLMSGGGTDADLVSIDKLHKDVRSPDGTTADASQSTAPAATQTDVATTTPTPAPATPAPAPTPAETPAPTPAPAVAATPAPTPDSAAVAADATAATSSLAPPPEPTTAVPAPAPQPVATSAPAPAPAPVAVTAPAPTPLVPTPSLTLAPTNVYPNNPALQSLVPPTDNPQASLMPAPGNATTALAGPVHMPPAGSAPSPSHIEHASHVEGQVYTVKITDSYKKIAKMHHITVAELKEANHIHDNVLHTGQKLIIPSAKTMVAKSEAKPEPSSLDAAPSTSVLSQAPTVHPAVFTSTTTSEVPLHEHTYTVAKGDTLAKIAHKFKTTTSAIMAVNSISDPAHLKIGKKLHIPSRESRTASVTPSPAPVMTPAPAPMTEPSEVKSETQVQQPVETIRPTPTVAPSQQDTQAAGDLATFQP